MKKLIKISAFLMMMLCVQSRALAVTAQPCVAAISSYTNLDDFKLGSKVIMQPSGKTTVTNDFLEEWRDRHGDATIPNHLRAEYYSERIEAARTAQYYKPSEVNDTIGSLIDSLSYILHSSSGFKYGSMGSNWDVENPEKILKSAAILLDKLVGELDKQKLLRLDRIDYKLELCISHLEFFEQYSLGSAPNLEDFSFTRSYDISMYRIRIAPTKQRLYSIRNYLLTGIGI
jgi:hypothetical protein